MALHSIAEHALLSRAAAALGPDPLAAQTDVAERVLGIESDYANTQYEDTVLNALALQVSYQLAQNYVAQSESRGARSRNSRTNSAGLPPTLHPLAKKMLERAFGIDGWADLKTRR